ncbi:hypothetical protein DCC62_23375 [candidate division KSB1 bacterium]|nr:MAG: hypothetical protein DCC62_23375 [candidate division KSB1 bacterium]
MPSASMPKARELNILFLFGMATIQLAWYMRENQDKIFMGKTIAPKLFCLLRSEYSPGMMLMKR